MPTKKNTNTDTTPVVENDPVTSETTVVDETRTVPQDFGPDKGSQNIAAAWQGLYWLLGARVEDWNITEDGVYAIGLTFDASRVPDAETVINDLSLRGDKMITRDLPLVPTYFWLKGEEPARFPDPASMTAWMAKFFRGAGDGDSNRSPQYLKDAIQAYKKDQGLVTRRGRPRTKIDIEALVNVNDDVLAKVSDEEIQKLETTLARIRAAKESEPVAVSA